MAEFQFAWTKEPDGTQYCDCGNTRVGCVVRVGLFNYHAHCFLDRDLLIGEFWLRSSARRAVQDRAKAMVSVKVVA